MLRHLRLLFWLRWKYFLRASFQRRSGFVLSVIISGVLALLLGGLLWALVGEAGRRELPSEDFLEYAAGGFALLYIGWLYFSSLSDLYDPQRLTLYPLRPSVLFWGSCLSAVIGVMPVHAAWIGAPLIFARPGPAWMILLRALWFPVLVLHLVAMSRLLRLSFLQLLTSRRWREAAVVVSTLIGGVAFLAFRSLQGEQMKGAMEWLRTQVEGGHLTRWLAWLPSTWFAAAMEMDGPRALVPAAAFLGLTVFLGYLGGRVERRLAFSEPVFAYGPKRKAAAGGPPRFLTGIVARIGRLVGDPAAAVARKELAVLGRDPTIRSRLLASLFYIFIPLIGPFVVKTSIDPDYLPDMVGGALLYLELSFFMNLFGTDGTALRTLAGMPTGRRQILIGKNVCYAVLLLPINFILISVSTAVFGDPGELPRNLVFHLAAFMTLLGAGNVFSLYFPLRMITPGQRLSRNDEDQGCLAMLLRIAAFMAVMTLTAPVVTARFLGTMPGMSGLGQAILVAGSLAYCSVLYGLGLWLAGRIFPKREERLVEMFAHA